MLIAALIIIFFILCYIGSVIILTFWSIYKKQNKNITPIKDITPIDVIIGFVYIFSLLVFGLGILGHYTEYYIPLESDYYGCYTPFSGRHVVTLNTYFILFNVSAFVIWLKGIKLPPILLVLLLALLFIGLVLDIAVISQLTEHSAPDGLDSVYLLLPAPIMVFIIGAYLIIKVTLQKSEAAVHANYSNKVLRYINHFLASRKRQGLIVILLLLPIFLLITMILTLFGQETDSIVKVFTDTTTWRFSQQMHPPPIYQSDDYLCTVAACGDPEVVKPLRLGQRRGQPIIVNRQLLIANAFESLLEDYTPALHRFIRKRYDKYGYSLAKKITTPALSNLTYILMKPLEWFFLLCLYLFCNKPEERIGRQYAG